MLRGGEAGGSEGWRGLFWELSGICGIAEKTTKVEVVDLGQGRVVSEELLYARGSEKYSVYMYMKKRVILELQEYFE